MSNLFLPDSANEKQLITGKIVGREQISKNTARTFFITLEFDQSVEFHSGDSIAIYPENSQKEILEFCQLLGLDPLLKFSFSNLHDYLAKKVSLSKWTSKMSQAVFADGKLPEDMKQKRPIEILKTVSLSKEQKFHVLSALAPQMPRYYSIASSPKTDSKHIDLLISLATYDMNGELKFGVASSFLCKDLPLGSTVYGFVHPSHHFKIPENGAPIIMIGPGTGVAPFRAFIQERVGLDLKSNWLFFGERHRKSDFYFENEFLRHQEDGFLKLSLAFSRDQQHKIYVQDLIMQEKKEVYDWIQNGAHIYVCGDASQMAKDVEQALISILCEFENLDPKQALFKLRSWKKENRYHLDVY